MIDARKCIAYHTIENKDEFPPDIREKLNNRIFGCDICQDACPWNKKNTETEVPEFHPVSGLLEMDKQSWHNLDQPTFNSMFRQTTIKRAGYKKLMQNISYTDQKE
jgi:epoxyqueuosine reductase